MFQEINLFEQSNVGLKKSDRILPSYFKLIGKKHGHLYIEQLCRKKNRNLLKCICDCGRVQYFYRYQLKNTKLCSHCQQQQSTKTQVSTQLYDFIKKRAEANNLPFELSYDYVNELYKKQNKKCVFTNKTINATYYQVNNNDADLTLINPQKGYVVGNVQWCSKFIAKIKSNLNDKDFFKLCDKIVKNYKRNSIKKRNKSTDYIIFG